MIFYTCPIIAACGGEVQSIFIVWYYISLVFNKTSSQYTLNYMIKLPPLCLIFIPSTSLVWFSLVYPVSQSADSQGGTLCCTQKGIHITGRFNGTQRLPRYADDYLVRRELRDGCCIPLTFKTSLTRSLSNTYMFIIRHPL